MRFVLYLLLVLWFSQAFCQDSTKVEKRNLPFNQGVIHSTFLKNGLKTVLIQKQEVPIIKIELSIQCGAMAQSENLDGIAQLFARNFFKPNKKYPTYNDFNAKINSLGITFSYALDNVNLSFSFSTHKKFFKESLLFFYDCLNSPAFNDLEIKREKILIANEIQSAEQNPVYFLMSEMQSILFKENYSRQNSIGNFSKIQNISIQDLEEFRVNYLYPNVSMISVTGEIDVQNDFKIIDAVFGQWQASAISPFESSPLPILSSVKLPVYHVVTNEKVQEPSLLITWKGANEKSIKNWLMGNLFIELINLRQNTIQSSVSDALMQKWSLNIVQNAYFLQPSLWVKCKNEGFNATLDSVKNFIQNGFYPDYYANVDWEKAKNLAKVKIQYQLEHPYNASRFLHQFWSDNQSANINNWNDTLKSLEYNDLIRFLLNNFSRDSCLVGVLTNSKIANESNLEQKIQSIFGLEKNKDIVVKDTLLTENQINTESDSVFNKFKNSNSKYINKPLINESFNDFDEIIDNKNIKSEKMLIFFALNKATFSIWASKTIEKTANKLNQDSTLLLLISGHTDSSGPADFNLKLSKERAETVKTFFVKQYKIDPKRIKTEGLGETKIAFPEDTFANRAKNRRVEFEIYKNE